MTALPQADDAGGRRLFIAALVAIAFLIADILLYPDTFTYVGIHLGGIRISPAKIFLVLTAPVIALYIWRNRRQLRFQAMDGFLLTTMAFVSIRGIIGAETTTIMGLIAGYTGYLLIIYYGAAVLGQKRFAFKALIWLVIGLGVLIAGYAIIEFYIGHNIYEHLIEDLIPDPDRWYHRSGSTLGHPLVLGLLMLQLAPIMVYYYVKEKDIRLKALWVLGICLFSLALMTTMSRGPWLTAGFLVIVAAGWYIWRYPSARKQAAALLASVILAVGIFTALNLDTLTSGTMSRERQSESYNPRLYMWSRVPTVFVMNPLIGQGMLQGGIAVSHVDPGPYTKIPIAVDNIYLTTVIDEGIVGTLLICGTLAMLIMQVVRFVRRNGKVGPLAAALAFGMSAVLIEGLSFDSMLFWATMVVFWLAAGLIRAMCETEERRSTTAGSRP